MMPLLLLLLLHPATRTLHVSCNPQHSLWGAALHRSSTLHFTCPSSHLVHPFLLDHLV